MVRMVRNAAVELGCLLAGKTQQPRTFFISARQSACLMEASVSRGTMGSL